MTKIMAEKRSNKVENDYFVFPHPFWIGAITFGLWLLFVSSYFMDICFILCILMIC